MQNHKKRIGTAAVIITLFLLVFASRGYFVDRYQYYADLNTLKQVAANLPASIPAFQVIKFQDGDAPIDDHHLAVNNHYTVIEYTQKGCPACVRLEKKFTDFLKVRKDVAIRKIAMPKDYYKTAERDFGRKVNYTPFIVIYGLDGKQIRADKGWQKPMALNLLNGWIKSELEEKG